MAIRIILDLDVENPEEIIKAHKGKLIGLLSDVVMSKESKRKKVNRLVAEQIVDVVQEELPKELEKEMVKAKISLRIVDGIEMES
jgi:lipoate-protein ligase A